MTRKTLKTVLRTSGRTLFFFLLNGFIFMAVFAKDEGQLGNNSFLMFIADYLWFLAYPTFEMVKFLAASTDLANTYYVLIAIGLTAILYMIFIEVIFGLNKRIKMKT